MTAEEMVRLLREKGFGARIEEGVVVVFLKSRKLHAFEVFMAVDLPEGKVIQTVRALVILTDEEG